MNCKAKQSRGDNKERHKDYSIYHFHAQASARAIVEWDEGWSIGFWNRFLSKDALFNPSLRAKLQRQVPIVRMPSQDPWAEIDCRLYKGY